MKTFIINLIKELLMYYFQKKVQKLEQKLKKAKIRLYKHQEEINDTWNYP